MGFLGMGMQEIVIIAIAALIIFGPDKLPELAGQAGKLLRDARRMTTDLQGEFEREAGVNVRELRSQVDREIAGVKGELTGATNTLQKEVNSAKRTAQSAASSANKSGSKSTSAKTTSSSSTASKSSSSVANAKSSTSSAKTAKVEEVKAVASKSDPLADVSFLDNVGEAPAVKVAANGAAKSPAAAVSSNTDRADAVQRARNRRLQAGYNQPR